MNQTLAHTKPQPQTGPDHRALMALIDASRAINQDLEPDAVFQRIAQHAATVLNAEGASVLLLTPDESELVFTVATGPAGPGLVGERFSANDGIAGKVLRLGEPLRVDDVQADPCFLPDIDAKTHRRTRSLLAAPVTDRGETFGVVEVVNPVRKDRFSDGDLDLLRVFANLAAIGARNVQKFDRVRKEAQSLRRQLPPLESVGKSASFKRAVSLCERVAAADTTVLLTGETGTGKELAARIVHARSPRRERPLIAINCAALPEQLLESELFGHERGAFTGAVEKRLGRFELADGGTIFLDEISELSPGIQAKLLRVLQEQEFTRVGGTETIRSNARIIAATNRDLKAETEAGRFREDLFYRLNVFPITLPPLREREADVALLVEHFVHEIAPQVRVAPPEITDEAMQRLKAYHWPGNIRELRNVVERLLLLTDGCIEAQHLPLEIRHLDQGDDTARPPTTSRLAERERAMIIDALEATNWNQSAAARRLGITRDHVRYRIKKYDLRRP